MDAQITTCQICGRPIKANTGVIAHHGYQRPGWGSQTSSCQGARYLPYEQSCDRIPVVIEWIKEHIALAQRAMNELRNNPPATLTTYRDRSNPRDANKITREKPEGFDPKQDRYSYSPYSYEGIFYRRIADFEQEIKAAQHNLEYLERRLVAWPSQPVLTPSQIRDRRLESERICGLLTPSDFDYDWQADTNTYPFDWS